MNDSAEHFDKNLFLDLEDSEGNTDNGVHLASMAGARMALSYGFAGFRTEGKFPALSPAFPESWGRVSFSLLYRKILLSLSYDPSSGELRLKTDRDMEIQIGTEHLRLKAGSEEKLNYQNARS